MIRFTKSSVTALEEKYVVDALYNGLLSGDGKYTKMVYEQFKERLGIERMLLTTSGTTALEMASILINLEPGDEVIAPSFTFSSTINAFLLRGAKPVFCDIRPDTMNIDERLIEGLITPKTKVYRGMIIGECNKPQDIVVNICKTKKLTNMRSSTADVMVTLQAHRTMALEECLEYISDDELVEITPENVRIRKADLTRKIYN